MNVRACIAAPRDNGHALVILLSYRPGPDPDRITFGFTIKQKTMKTSLIKLFVVGLLLTCADISYAQIVKYHEHDETEELRIEYRWQRERIYTRAGNAVLNLQLTNLQDLHREVSFVVAFYSDKQVVFESEENTLCFKPGQRRRGFASGLRFFAEGIGLDDVEKDDFSWDILIRDIREVSGCD